MKTKKEIEEIIEIERDRLYSLAYDNQTLSEKELQLLEEQILFKIDLLMWVLEK